VSLFVSRARGLPAIRGDVNQVRQVLLELIANAVQAVSQAPLEGRIVTVTTEVGADGRARICVRDHGAWIPADQLEALVNPLPATGSAGEGGGLAMSRAIAEQHGGRLRAQNHPEGGKTFCVEFPPA
jgi:C4-dicarboxylate-specific signal transduction histidine kinase